MTDTKELKPCPFCGGTPHVVREGTSRQSCIIECGNCGCSLEGGEIGYGKQWNRRSESQGTSPDLVKLKELAEKASHLSWEYDGKFTVAIEQPQGGAYAFRTGKNDAEFIAAANPQTILALIAEVEAARG